LAERVLANFVIRESDVMMIFSASGLAAMPIEMAIGAREAGARIIAVTSVAQSTAEPPRHSSNTRLLDHADVILDLHTPVGDALIDVDGLEQRVGPASTIAAVAYVNAIKVRTAELLAADGITLPVITSGSVVGDERSQELFEAAYREHARRAGSRLRH
jgi:uncharacterized phosphosugar-binding protein